MIVVNHDETYSPLANMAQFHQQPLAGNRVETFFENTPLISPSSLAFFVSGFKETTRRTRREDVQHLVAVRQTETDYQEKLFEMTEQILDTVESFMSVHLPVEFLHSVALPSFEIGTASFYGFNFYR